MTRPAGRLRIMLIAALVLASLLLGVDMLAWSRMQRLLDHRMQQFSQDAGRAGWGFSIASARRGGWPLAATLSLAAPRLHGADSLVPGGVTWSAERITASLSMLHPGAITILAGGAQTVSAGSPATRNIGGSLRFWGPRIALRLASASGSIRQAAFDAGPLHVALPGAGPDDVLTLSGLDGTLRWNADAHALRLSLHDLGLPSEPGGTTRRTIQDAALELSLVGRTGEGDLAARMRAWRDSGGRLILRQASLAWPGGGIEASGEASLDGNFQPDGRFTARIDGVDALLGSLVRSGQLLAATATAIRAVLGLIGDARNAAGVTGPATLELPLSLRDGRLLLGQIPLLRIPPMRAPP